MEAAGSTAETSTSVLDNSRRMTLHGSIVPTRGSLCTSLLAVLGKQARTEQHGISGLFVFALFEASLKVYVRCRIRTGVVPGIVIIVGELQVELPFGKQGSHGHELGVLLPGRGRQGCNPVRRDPLIIAGELLCRDAFSPAREDQDLKQARDM